MRRLGLLFLLLMLSPLAYARGAEAHFKALLGEALDIRPAPPTEGATLHPLFLSLETLPDGAAASAALRERVRSGIATPDLRASATALCLLQLALEGRTVDHATGFATFQASGAPEAVISQADARTATAPCPTCAGRRWVCPACRGIVLCMACGGRGNGFKRAEGFALTEAKRIPCATCGGSGLCRVCRGVRKVCPTCRDAGTVVSPERLRDRISRLAGAAARRTQRCAEEEAAARSQTDALALALRLCRGLPAPASVVAHLRALRGERLEQAAQWPRLPALIAAAEAWENAATAEAAPPPTAQTRLVPVGGKSPVEVAEPQGVVVAKPPAKRCTNKRRGRRFSQSRRGRSITPAAVATLPVEQKQPASVGGKPSVEVAEPQGVVAATPPAKPFPAPVVAQESPAVEAPPAAVSSLDALAEGTASRPWGWMAAGVFTVLVLYVLGAVLLTARRSR